MDRSHSRATRLLERMGGGDSEAATELLELVREELHSLARNLMRGERPGHTLQPTALVNEAWLRLMGAEAPLAEDRRHFLRLAARAMRRVLVDHARARSRDKRGGGRTHVQLDDAWEEWQKDSVDVLELEEVLRGLDEQDPELARVVELRFFTGLTLSETAAVLGTTEEGVRWSWKLARAWLRRELERGREGAG